MDVLRKIKTEETIPLRHSILRPNQSLEDCEYPGDDDPHTLHVGLFQRNTLVGIASVYREDNPSLGPRKGWRLRGMAVLEKHRNAGIGKKLLDACIEHAKGADGAYLWCNARPSASGLYDKNQFHRVGDEFDIPDIGPHYLMVRELD